MRLLGTGLAAAFILLWTNTAFAIEGKKMDCADLDMAFKAPDFDLTCMDFSDASALSNAGRLRAERLVAISEKRLQVLAVWDVRALGSIYLKRRGLEEDVKDFFSEQTIEAWKPVAPADGFEMAEYVNLRGGATREDCIAFRRQITRRNGGAGDSGFGRIVLGIGCTGEDRAGLIDSLKQLDAPGG